MYRSLILTSLAAAFTLLLVPSSAEAATASGYREFTLPQDYDTAVAWYEVHRAGVLQASNCRIVKDLGDGLYQVQTNTPIGACFYQIKETHTDKTNEAGQRVTTYRLSFVRNISGRVSNAKVTIQLTENGGTTKLQLWMTTSVAGRFVPQFAVANVLNSSLSGSEAYVQRHAK
jgi:hypothetical protein